MMEPKSASLGLFKGLMPETGVGYGEEDLMVSPGVPTRCRDFGR